MKRDHVEFLLEEAITAELAAMPLLAAKFRKIADEIKRLRRMVRMAEEGITEQDIADTAPDSMNQAQRS